MNNPWAIPPEQNIPAAEDCPLIGSSWDTEPQDIRGTLVELDRKLREQAGWPLPDISLGIIQVQRIADLNPRKEYRDAARDFLRTYFNNIPTLEGKRRYEPSGLFDGEPCTCEKECPPNCKSQCGCKACRAAYGDYLSSQGD